MKTKTVLNAWMKLSVLATATICSLHTAVAATTATIDLNTQKFIGGVSDLDRSKYFNIHGLHSTNGMTTTELDYIKNELNAGYGRSFWSPFSAYNGNAPYPSEATAITNGASNITNTKNSASYPYFSKNYIVTDHPKNIFVAGEDPLLAAEWAANYFKHYYH